MASVGWFQLDMDCQRWFCYGCIMVNLKRSGSLHQLFFYSFRKIVTVSKCYQIDMACFRPVAAAGQLLAVHGYDLALLQMVSDGWFQLDLDCFGWFQLQMVLGGYKWFQVVCCFSSHRSSIHLYFQTFIKQQPPLIFAKTCLRNILII